MIEVSKTIKRVIFTIIVLLLISLSIFLGLKIKQSSYDTYEVLGKQDIKATRSLESTDVENGIFRVEAEEYNRAYPKAEIIWASMKTDGKDIVNDALMNSNALLSISPFASLLEGSYTVAVSSRGYVVIKYENNGDWLMVECNKYNAVPMIFTKQIFTDEEKYFITGAGGYREVTNEDNTISLYSG